MVSYEILRRFVPSVYASKRQQAIMRGEKPTTGDDYYMPFDWLMPVFGVPWSKVRKAGGLDAYMFLRYLRMCLRITSVSAFWGIVILWPVYGNADGPYSDAFSWYHFSMANIDQGSWRIWVPTIFIYLFSFFSFFCIKQELKHYVELRMEFLGKGPCKWLRSGHRQVHLSTCVYMYRHHTELLLPRMPCHIANCLYRNMTAHFSYSLHSSISISSRREISSADLLDYD